VNGIESHRMQTVRELRRIVLTTCPRCGVLGPRALLRRHLMTDHALTDWQAAQAARERA
jgi:hypothetical protein